MRRPIPLLLLLLVTACDRLPGKPDPDEQFIRPSEVTSLRPTPSLSWQARVRSAAPRSQHGVVRHTWIRCLPAGFRLNMV